MLLAEPAAALTDLSLAVVVAALTTRVRHLAGVSRHWVPMFGWVGVSALLGVVHHAVLVRWQPVASVSWAVISVMVVVSLAYLLLASADEVLGSGRHLVLRWVGIFSVLVYAGLAAAMLGGPVAILAAESPVMVCVLGLWGSALVHRHPMADWVAAALVVSGGGAVTLALPALRVGGVVLDQNSVYHLVQIVGMVLIFVGVRRGAQRT
ncbi:MAG TPA: hypothetical protein VFI30_01375 [Nocardioidaceae bacterium]|nr:hypothetical protein [Nocardioidaceae bacterium]